MLHSCSGKSDFVMRIVRSNAQVSQYMKLIMINTRKQSHITASRGETVLIFLMGIRLIHPVLLRPFAHRDV